MKRYENFSPNIPESNEPIEAELPAFTPRVLEKEESKREERPRNSRKTTQKIKKEKTKKSSDPGFFRKSHELITGTTTKWIIGLLMGLTAIYLAIAFISYISSCVSDQSEINNTAIGFSGEIANAAGEGGARISEFLINEFFGIGSFVIIFWLFAMGLRLLSGKPRFKPLNFTIKCLIAFITLSLIVGLLTIGTASTVNWGGYHGRYINEFILHFVGWSGAILLSIFMLCCFVLICMRDVFKWIKVIKGRYDEKRRIREEKKQLRLAREKEIDEMRRSENSGQGLQDSENISENSEDSDQKIPVTLNFESEGDHLYSKIEDFDDAEFASYNLEDNDNERDTEIPNQEEEKIPETPAIYSLAETPATTEEKLNPMEVNFPEVMKESYDEESLNKESEKEPEDLQMVVNVNTITETGGKKPNHHNDGPGSYPYHFPPFDILRPGEGKVSVDADEQLENKEKIKRTLLDFDIPITSIEATVGPTVTLYEIVPDKGVRVSKIRALVDDIALSLAVEGVRIIAPIPGKGTVGIEVANKDKQTVSMRTVLKSKNYQETKYKLPVAVGSTISNDVFIADLAKMPHLLVAGATGQGKSVGLNAIIASLLYSKRPDELKFVMIDPKMVEFSLYAKIEGHYLAKIPEAEDAIITDMDKVVATLSSLCIEMDNRYQLLKEGSVRNIIEYNEKIQQRKLNPNDGHRYLPYIVVIVDEFSDLIMTAGKEVEIPIARLAQKARAVGMHVIIATQRPSTNVITGIIKANFPARIAFKVSSGVDSKTILDTTGAQQLIGKGDMLISNSAPMVRVQCAFIDTPEVEQLCDHISRQPYAQGAYLLPEPATKGEIDTEGNGSIGTERDPLFEEVARLVVTSNNASTSSLQRRYSIGYNRAGKIMDQLEAAGIVGPAQGGKPRAVLMDPVTLDLLLSN